MVKLDNYLNQIQTEVVITTTVLAGLSAANLIVAGVKLYKSNFTKAARQCAGLPEKEKALCMLKTKALAKNVQLKSLQSNTGKCVKTKNPEKCKDKLSNTINKLSKDIKYLNKRFKNLRATYKGKG